MEKINFDDLLQRFRYPILVILLGIFLTGVGFFFYKSEGFGKTKVEVLENSTESSKTSEIVVDIEGEVQNPGVYKLSVGSRLDDLIIVAGGFSADADRELIEKTLNRAVKLSDGQKVYIPKIGEQTLGTSANLSGGDQTVSSNFSGQNGGLININTASLSELDKLPGIGPVYGQSIIDHRPYSNIDELVKTGSIKQSVFEKIKDKIFVY